MNNNTLEQAKKFIKKNCRLYGNGISFYKEESRFSSYVLIESKQEVYSNVDWWERDDSFSIQLKVQDAIEIVEGKIENILNETLFNTLIINGIKDMRETFKFKAECFDRMLDHLGISEGECVSIMIDLFLDKCKSSLDKSFPVAQRSYDKWVEKGCQVQVKKERIASTFGKDFLDSLTDGISSFHDVYIQNQTESLFEFFKMQYGRFTKRSDEDLMKQAKNEANSSWPLWLKFEVYGITDILLNYNVGKCDHYNLDFDTINMKVEGDIFGEDGKRLHFHTIFAGGYNIQRLHTRTIAHVFED